MADTYNKDGLDPKTLENIYRFHLFTPTAEEFRELFEKAGFTDIKIHVKRARTGSVWKGKNDTIYMIPGSKGQKADPSLLARGF